MVHNRCRNRRIRRRKRRTARHARNNTNRVNSPQNLSVIRSFRTGVTSLQRLRHNILIRRLAGLPVRYQRATSRNGRLLCGRVTRRHRRRARSRNRTRRASNKDRTALPTVDRRHRRRQFSNRHRRRQSSSIRRRVKSITPQTPTRRRCSSNRNRVRRHTTRPFQQPTKVSLNKRRDAGISAVLIIQIYPNFYNATSQHINTICISHTFTRNSPL